MKNLPLLAKADTTNKKRYVLISSPCYFWTNEYSNKHVFLLISTHIFPSPQGYNLCILSFILEYAKRNFWARCWWYNEETATKCQLFAHYASVLYGTPWFLKFFLKYISNYLLALSWKKKTYFACRMFSI